MGVTEKHYREKVGHPDLGSEGSLYFTSGKSWCRDHGAALAGK